MFKKSLVQRIYYHLKETNPKLYLYYHNLDHKNYYPIDSVSLYKNIKNNYLPIYNLNYCLQNFEQRLNNGDEKNNN